MVFTAEPANRAGRPTVARPRRHRSWLLRVSPRDAPLAVLLSRDIAVRDLALLKFVQEADVRVNAVRVNACLRRRGPISKLGEMRRLTIHRPFVAVKSRPLKLRILVTVVEYLRHGKTFD
jgi:hypothetical protein